MSNDDFGDRMKEYESAEAARKAMPWLPLCMRFDGNCFSTWTSKLVRPYDERLSILMQDVTKYLIEITGAKIGYTQSDEISLILMQDESNFASEHWFDGKFQKLVSVACSKLTAKFNEIGPSRFKLDAPSQISLNRETDWPGLAFFDCRVWNVPSKEEAANTILWREKDATKNSISMAARYYYSHSELHGKNGLEMQDLISLKGIDWNDYPAFFKRGSFFQAKKIERKFTPEEILAIPEKFRSKMVDLIVSRREIVAIDMPPFTKVTNRVSVIFEGADPKIESLNE